MPAAAISGVMLFLGADGRIGAMGEQQAHHLDIGRLAAERNAVAPARCRR